MMDVAITFLPGKNAQLQRLAEAGVHMNLAAQRIFRVLSFSLEGERVVRILSAKELGCPQGGRFSEIIYAARQHGLMLCPPETGIFLRLAMKDQPISTDSVLTGAHCAPQGAVTVASAALSVDPDFPRGFYLRNVDGVLWLRGFVCDDAYLWSPADLFAFMTDK